MATSRENFGCSLKKILELIGWDVQTLSDQLDGAFTLEFLERAIHGKPLPEAEAKITDAVVPALEQYIYAEVLGTSLPDRAATLAAQVYIQQMKKHRLSLGDALTIAEEFVARARNVARLATYNVADRSVWTSVIEEITLDVIAPQGKLTDDKSSDHSVTASRSTPPRNASGAVMFYRGPEECWNCGKLASEQTSSRCGCGVNWSNQNW